MPRSRAGRPRRDHQRPSCVHAPLPSRPVKITRGLRLRMIQAPLMQVEVARKISRRAIGHFGDLLQDTRGRRAAGNKISSPGSFQHYTALLCLLRACATISQHDVNGWSLVARSDRTSNCQLDGILSERGNIGASAGAEGVAKECDSRSLRTPGCAPPVLQTAPKAPGLSMLQRCRLMLGGRSVCMMGCALDHSSRIQ